MSNTAFNPVDASWIHHGSEQNFRNFYKRNKTILSWMHFFTFIAFLIITFSLNEPLNRLFYHYVGSYFATFQFKGFFERLFSYSALFQMSKISQHDNLFKNYQIVLLGATVVLASDLVFLLFDFVTRKRRLNELKLSFGVFVHPDLDKWSKEVLKSFIDCAVVVVKSFLCWAFLTLSIFNSLRSINIFEHNFFLCALQFAAALFIFIPCLIMYNYYSWYTEYYMHFTKLPKYKNTKESMSFLGLKMLKESVLTLLSFFSILVSLPYDLFLIYLFAKHSAWQKPDNTRGRHIKHKFIY